MKFSTALPLARMFFLATSAIVLILSIQCWIPALGQTAQPIITIENISGMVSYRKGRLSEGCSQTGPQPGGYKPIYYDEIKAICVSPQGEAQIWGCPDTDGKPKPGGKAVPVDGRPQEQAISRLCAKRPVHNEEVLLGGWTESIPYIINPRHTRLLSRKLVLRWNSIDKNTTYKVVVCKIESDGKCSIVVDASKYVDSENLAKVVELEISKELDEGSYQLQVRTEAKSSDMEKIETKDYPMGKGFLGTEFYVPPQDRISYHTKKAYHMRNSKFAKQRGDVELAVADYYESEQFYSDAIDELENAIKTKGGKPEFYLKLGDVYRKIGLNALASSKYKLASIPEARDKLGKLCDLAQRRQKKLPGCADQSHSTP